MTTYQHYSSLQCGYDRYSSSITPHWPLATLFMDALIAFKTRTAELVVPVAEAACDEPVDMTWLNG